MGSKQKTTQTQTYGWQQTPGSADISALRNMKATVNPTIPYQYAARKENYENTWQNPLGSATSPAAREAAQRSMNERGSMDEAQAMREAYHDASQQDYSRQAAIAGMTAPQLVGTGGTNVTQQSPGVMGILSPLIGAGASLGSAALT